MSCGREICYLMEYLSTVIKKHTPGLENKPAKAYLTGSWKNNHRIIFPCEHRSLHFITEFCSPNQQL